MRIRSTKPEFWRSRRIAEVDWETRFVLKGLESYVDDNGVGKDDIELIVGDIFSRDMIREPSRTLKRVQVAIDTLHSEGLVHRYTVEGTDLLFIAWWDSTQYINRPSKGRFRRPDGTLNYGESAIGPSLLSPQEPSSNFSAGTEEQRNRGTEEQTLSADTSAATARGSKTKPNDLPEGFEQWWDAYGKKRKRVVAIKAYRKALTKTDAATLLMAASEFIAWEQKRPDFDIQFVPDPSTWLNQERWNDERAARSTTSPRPTLTHVNDLREPPEDILDDPVKLSQWYAEDAKRRSV